MKHIMPLLFCLFVSAITQGQEPTLATDRLKAHEYKSQAINQSHFSGVTFRSVGPTVMSGRVVDLAVNPVDATHFFVAYASGGLWETRNNGHSFEPLFDNQAVMTIGAIAVNWSDTSIWIGTGEVNSSRSSYSGVGMFFSADQGKTWEHKGLADSHHIGRVIIHPEDPNTVWVASLGKLYSEGVEEGVFKTSDGGKTWFHVITERVGAVDMVIHPENPDILYAALWDRDRKAWNFKGSSSKSGIYRSMDGGVSWELLTGPDSGFPHDEGVGRIGLDITAVGGKSYLYAMHDNQNRRPKEKEEAKKGLQRKDFESMTKEEFLDLDQQKVVSYLKDNDFPKKYSYDFVRKAIEKNDISPTDLSDYLTDANTQLFDTPVIGAEVYLFDHESGKWSKTHEGYLDDVVYSYGYYFGLIRVHPRDPKQVYIAGVPLIFSNDSGATWKSINPENVHADHHALWINPERHGHLINGNDGGINITYDNGAHYVNCNSPAVGQFYTVQVDDAKPYNVYGGLQDNGVWKGPSTYEASSNWLQNGDYPYKMIMGGDGMQIEVDPRDNETVYTGYQFGHYYRLKEGEKSLYIHPMHELGEKPLRWNWQTPIHLSTHNLDILYMGSNKLHRSMNKGETWEAISGDMTGGGIEGNVPFGTLTSIDESPLSFGKLYTGSDDGKVHVSLDAGHEWKDISAGLPPNLWVSRVEASKHKENRAYVSLNGYRNDHMDAYVYRSDDEGQTWERIGKDLPREPVNVILEDDVEADILYVGTDHGLYVSMDGGSTFHALMNGMPHAPVHDLVIQKREQDLVVGTHGRSIYIADISTLRKVADAGSEMQLFTPDSLTGSKHWGSSSWSIWMGANEPEMHVQFYEMESSACHVDILSEKGTLLSMLKVEPLNGLQSTSYDLTLDEGALARLKSERKRSKKDMPEEATNGKTYLDKGDYSIQLVCGTKSVKKPLLIR